MAHILSTPTGLAGHDVQGSGFQGARMAPSQGAGRRPIGDVARNKGRTPKGYWAGSQFGVREPAPAETPLSWDEIMHGLRWEVL